MTVDLDYIEWLSRLVNFNSGPLDQKRLASALLAVLPVVRAADALPVAMLKRIGLYEHLEWMRAALTDSDTMRTQRAKSGAGDGE